MSTEVSAEYVKAKELDRRIKTSAQLAQQSLYDMCMGFKEMRDGKLYKELGYQNFEEYCEQETGFKRRQVYKYIAVAEKLPQDFVQSTAQIGAEKLYLLSTLSEEERTKTAENTDLQNVSVKELQSEIDKIKSENKTLSIKLDDLNRENVTITKQRETLISQRDKLEDQVTDLERQIEELENRPIDVTVCESDSHEIENLKKAMKICDDRWAEKYNELQEDTITQTRELHQNYKAQIERLTADYEKKLAEIPVPSESAPEQVTAPDMKETFKAYYSMAYNAFNAMAEFVKKQSEENKRFCLEKSDKLINILKKSIQEV